MEDMAGNKIYGNSTVELYHDGPWNGFRAKVSSRRGENLVWLSPLSPRPDGNGMNKFVWPLNSLTVVN
ncbi:hypothetical protein SEA_SPILLED_255 [Streptomyces phage Spilled]|nr:hypothetical protein SEA_WIPEOUT_238 [Streptomyces phage Wipeout]QGH79095.1 hypothetical protein SEA_TOMSAWYER_252 [Streptomyces phage TomSawyer]URM86778.1 hypothetical protein SEA_SALTYSPITOON_248 [Streptomyces phage SaltySpitoon]URM87732.1 hypothetical protein SEA_QUARAN19_248 [Streptomyces phage Quaran19]UVK60102.1 hypothetical protein SEA_SPILLED_255 [Streptomyces phage Spilled]UVK61057.1 hypothetical protein SEA_JIMJAM_255 [Streptomyces phage JimJam]WGH19995.1 hypothetical protein SEA